MSTETIGTSRVALPPADRAPGFRRALGYEWTSFRTLLSNWVLMWSALVVQILLTVVAHNPPDNGGHHVRQDALGRLGLRRAHRACGNALP
ncbi:hypothetical protein MOQ72_17615 [Saccharopolyspora sp. K220]|uniref:hypothetical protein n=1 Tax=Saccharopolyspora soli TaxID=2926618 RepID=UPI001F5A8154|nr:hypothetical protein [Saccharopolyspora soli]MCI2419267.1 hypothetical protein [Saccharopolyspora soli]